MNRIRAAVHVFVHKSVVAVLLLGLPACFIARVEGGPQPAGPEQFVFTVVPGAGPGDEATAAVASSFGDAVDVDHRASVETPLGRFSFYRYTQIDGSEQFECAALIGANAGSASCGVPGSGEIDPETVTVAGIGLDSEWSTVELHAGRAVATATAVAADDTVYRTNLIDGFGLIVHPIRRGSLLVQGFDRDGEPLGEPVASEGPEGG